MGKPQEHQILIPAAETVVTANAPHPRLAAIRRAFSFRCVLMLLLSVVVLNSAVFWLLPIISSRPGFVPDDDAASAKVQACFILQKPLSLLTLHSEKLEYDIFEEIGVPNTKVSIISMHPTAAINCTSVAFGVLPKPRHASITLPVLSLLRSSLIELALQQINLTLTPSIFGETLSFEVLKFPGGITVIPPQTASIWERTQALFNFTISNSIVHIQENMAELKDQLKIGLNLRPYEKVYVQMTNAHGSTVAPPVTLQISILSDFGNGALLPDRLKQLANTITGSHVQNLGLNHSVFGEVKWVVLSSYLNNSISSISASSPSPSPSPSPIATPCPPSEECPCCNVPSSSSMLSPCSPPPVAHDDLQPSCIICDKFSPTLSHTFGCRIGSQPAYSSYPAGPIQVSHMEYKSPRLTSQRSYAVFDGSTLLVQDKESIKDSTLKMPDLFLVSSSSTTHGSTSNTLKKISYVSVEIEGIHYVCGIRRNICNGAWLISSAAFLILVLLFGQ